MPVENGLVKSETILREIRARVLTLVKSPPTLSRDTMTTWEIELRTLLNAEVVYNQPQIIPLGTPDQRYQVRP